MRLDPEILDGPAELGARIVALARLADAEDALGRLAPPGDPRALHDFTSALRRLRSALGALRPALPAAVAEEHVPELRAAARPAGPAREAELLAGWLQGIRGELPGPYRGALDWLADRVERRSRRAAEEVAAESVPRFRRVAPRLQRELAARRPSAPRRAGAPSTFGALLAGLLRAHARALREALAAVAGSSDAEGLERARIAAKRLRNLLEPLRGADATAGEALDALAPLADALGAWVEANAARDALDAALLEARVEEVRRGAAALAGLRPGLLAVLGTAERRMAELYRSIEAEHLAVKGTPVTDAAYAVVAALEARAAAGDGDDAAPAIPERRFLVTGMPDGWRSGDAEEVEQGWLPGDGRESVGVRRSPAGELWFRAHGSARGRPERLEPISRPEYEAFWPLTAGRRIARRRHRVAEAPGWALDEYLDRPLVLAVAAEGTVGAPPEWLEPVLVREVSPERGYLDEALARRPARRAG